MPADADSLPDDIEALKALLRQRDGELQQLRDTVSTLEQALSVRALEFEQLHLQLAKLKRMQFGRKSAKLDRPIERGVAGPGLLAHILVSKFADHQPLYWQSVIYARDGVALDRSTMARWVASCGALLDPLVQALRQYVLAPGKVHGDDKPVQVLAPGNGKTRTGRFWVYVRDDRHAGSAAPPAVWFAYAATRQGRHPQSHLSEFSGVLQADAYAGYNDVYADGRIREAACMAHARRKIHDVHVGGATATTSEALRRIGELYAIEAQIRGHLPDRRHEVRQQQARQLLDSLHAWLQERLLTLSRHSDTAKAINYMLNHWQALAYYCEDGRVEIDNNIAENALRGVSLGRKNFLFLAVLC
ncbi:MAG: tnpC [Noviherbaspirillum sp.]|nr:tnpC [Noviherbaspirillum sp.]